MNLVSHHFILHHLEIWKFVHESITIGEPLVLMVVLESVGSSPGRQGFKMAVSQGGLKGSVGGGIMEHKFVEMARQILEQQQKEVDIRQQIHSKNSPRNQSGMICSGEQTIAIFPLAADFSETCSTLIEHLQSKEKLGICYSSKGIVLETGADKPTGFIKKSDLEWHYRERTGASYFLHIVGGGHVSLAFSRLMAGLQFHITVYDDRPGLNTMEQNIWADERKWVDYEAIDQYIPEGQNQLVVIMTFGYRPDGVVLRKLLHRKFLYLGLLGSQAKILKMWEELKAEGFSDKVLEEVHAPVGLPIKSQTPEEIAVSIAAQIILIRNEDKLKIARTSNRD